MANQKIDLKEFHESIKYLGFEISAMSSVSEGRSKVFTKEEGGRIELQLWNDSYWRFVWVGGIGIVMHTLDSYGSDVEYIKTQLGIIENAQKNLLTKTINNANR